jgi:hypothetical protein
MKITSVGLTLTIFLAVTLTLCMVWGLIAPLSLHMHAAWEPLLPEFEWSLSGYLIGLAWIVVYSWYTALVFVPIYNVFNKKKSS